VKRSHTRFQIPPIFYSPLNNSKISDKLLLDDAFLEIDWEVLEIDPISLKVVWQYTPSEAGCKLPDRFYWFYSPLISSAQRLPNRNTMITIGSAGIIIEVTPDHDVVWECISPFFLKELNSNLIYRAYRVPYDWVPQLEKTEEVPVEKRDVSEFSLSGRSPKEVNRVIDMADMKSFEVDFQSCVVPDDKETDI
jgi:hypothetical protein